MDLIMYVLVGLLVVALASVAYVVLRNRVMFKIGVRNIPRRRAQTVLIVLGLMLSTLIISAAFATGDTVDRSITGEIYALLGSLDESIETRAADDEAFDQSLDSIARPETFSAADAERVIRALDGDPLIDALVPVYSQVATAVNLEKRQSSPLFMVVGLDPTRSRALPDIESVRGGRLRVEGLGPGEIYVDESAADELGAGVGDRIDVFALGKSASFTIKAVVKDRRLAGAGGISIGRQGGVVPLAVAQDLFASPGRVTSIAVSNKGDSREGLAHSAAVVARIKAVVAAEPSSPALSVSEIKRRGVDIAEVGANIFTTFFLVLGLFSIAAGVLLIFMIFVMLAAERKPEMGMARAVGTKRADLVQTFLSEGMTYNMLAAMVGTAFGVAVAFAMARVMASLFSQFDISISPHVTPRSLIISYCLGVVLTFFTVTFSSWRVSNINIVRAIRDIPEPPMPKPLWRAHGFFATIRRLLFHPGSGRAWALRSTLFVVGIAATGAGVASGSLALQVSLSLLSAVSLGACILLTFQFGPLFIVAGAPLVLVGASTGQVFALYAGLSFLPLGLALAVRSFGAPERLTYSAAGLFLLYLWEFDFQLKVVQRIFGEMEGHIEMFFLSGIMVTVAVTFLIVYNSDLLLRALTRLGSGLGALLPSIKMAVAYPLANKMRTGMTMAMFCLVVFALTVMSSMNHNFNQVFLSDRALGGWDITVDENPANPIGDLKQALTAAASPAASKIDVVGVSAAVTRGRARLCQEQPGKPACDVSKLDDFESYPVRGDDPGFFASSSIALQARAKGYASDEAVWQAVASDPSLAVIDAFAVPGGGPEFGGGAPLKDVDAGASEIDPIRLTLMDRSTRRSGTVTVIGIIELGSSATFTGLHVSQETMQTIFGKPDIRRIFVKTVPGADKRGVSREIESALLTTGAQADSLRHQLDQQNATQSGFFYLMQGFMGLGLFVGVAAVGVIAFRTVVERRQQIGMLRALGYTRGMIGLTFLIESAFIAFMGVASGIVFALILARQLITDEFANQGVTTFLVPWTQVGVIGGLAFGFALLMTVVPSRQAAGIPIAQALRYE